MNRISSSEIDPHIYGHWFLTKVPRFNAGKHSLKGVGSTWKYICIKKKNLELYLTSFIRINLKFITDTNIRAQTVTFIHENKGENLCGVGLGNGFLGKEQKHNHKRKINKLDFIKMKNFCSSKDTIKKINGKPCRENICKIHNLLKTCI